MNKRKKLKIAFGNALMMIHFIALIALIIGVVMLYTNDNLKKGITWVNNESYEDSPAFVKQLEGDIQKIFDYIRYKDVFETDGVFDLKKEMFNINMAPGEDISYTVEDVIKNAKELGYYVDDNYNFSIYEGADKALFSENSLLVNSRSYMQNVQIDEPGDAYMTLPVLIEESLNVLSKYYAAYNRLILVPGNIKYRVVYDTNKYTNDKGLNVSNVKSYGKYVISSSHSMLIDHNLSLPPSNLSYLATSFGRDVEIDDYDIMIAVDTSYPVKDEYSIGKDRYVEQRNWYFYGCVNIVCSIPIMLLSIIFTLILYKNKVASAYIIFGLYEENIEIRECMALDGISYKEILALIYGYRDYYKNVSLASPNNSSLEFLFENQLNIEKIVKPFMMMRILDPLAIFKNLKLENHNIYIYIEDKILKENTGLYYFLNKKFTFYALPVEKSIYHLRIDIADLVFLITGYFSIDDLVKMGKIDISNKETLRKLKRIFSKKNSYLYEFI